MHAVHVPIHVRACPYYVFERGICTERQQPRDCARQTVGDCHMQCRSLVIGAAAASPEAHPPERPETAQAAAPEPIILQVGGPACFVACISCAGAASFLFSHVSNKLDFPSLRSIGAERQQPRDCGATASAGAPRTSRGDSLAWSVVRRFQKGSARTTLGTDGVGGVSVAQQAEQQDRWQACTRRLARRRRKHAEQ